MKKISVLLIFLVLFITGCGKTNKESVLSDFSSKVNKAKSYEINGNMKIYSDEDIYDYELNVKHLSDDYYKVALLNTTNDHEQIILKNEDGVYVVTPSLNKSFKFQSNWPNNSSQSYLLESILTDMKNDNKIKFEEKKKEYILTVKVNYPNNEELKYEKIYFDKKINLKKVEIFNDNDNLKVMVNFNKINLRASLDEDDFKLDDLVTNEECSNCEIDKDENTESTSKIEDIVYPLYVPENTSLTSKDIITTEEGERAILTFGGDNSFILVEETAKASNEFEVIPVYGDPEIINDSIGALSSNSLSWSSNNVNYYLTATNLSKKELKTIAQSINNTASVNAEK